MSASKPPHPPYITGKFVVAAGPPSECCLDEMESAYRGAQAGGPTMGVVACACGRQWGCEPDERAESFCGGCLTEGCSACFGPRSDGEDEKPYYDPEGWRA